MWGQRKEGAVTCSSTVGKTSHGSIGLAPKPVLFPTHKKGTKWNLTHIWRSILCPFLKFPLFSQLRFPSACFPEDLSEKCKGTSAHWLQRDAKEREFGGHVKSHQIVTSWVYKESLPFQCWNSWDFEIKWTTDKCKWKRTDLHKLFANWQCVIQLSNVNC